MDVENVEEQKLFFTDFSTTTLYCIPFTYVIFVSLRFPVWKRGKVRKEFPPERGRKCLSLWAWTWSCFFDVVRRPLGPAVLPVLREKLEESGLDRHPDQIVADSRVKSGQHSLRTGRPRRGGSVRLSCKFNSHPVLKWLCFQGFNT